MGAAQANPDFLDGSSTTRAGLIFSFVDIEIILKLTTSINPINAGTQVLNAFLQDALDGMM